MVPVVVPVLRGRGGWRGHAGGCLARPNVPERVGGGRSAAAGRGSGAGRRRGHARRGRRRGRGRPRPARDHRLGVGGRLPVVYRGRAAVRTDRQGLAARLTGSRVGAPAPARTASAPTPTPTSARRRGRGPVRTRSGTTATAGPGAGARPAGPSRRRRRLGLGLGRPGRERGRIRRARAGRGGRLLAGPSIGRLVGPLVPALVLPSARLTSRRRGRRLAADDGLLLRTRVAEEVDLLGPVGSGRTGPTRSTGRRRRGRLLARLRRVADRVRPARRGRIARTWPGRTGPGRTARTGRRPGGRPATTLVTAPGGTGRRRPGRRGRRWRDGGLLGVGTGPGGLGGLRRLRGRLRGLRWLVLVPLAAGRGRHAVDHRRRAASPVSLAVAHP
jgi:hypothetical protein